MTPTIQSAFDKTKSAGRTAFIPFVTGGYPDRDTCVEILLALDANGAGVIEVGLPFSDPLADGPTIQMSSKQALDNGITPPDVLRIIEEVRPRIAAPIVIMTYYNPVLRMGLEQFAARARESGVSGLIIPDLPPEEADDWLQAAGKHSLDTVFLVAPTTPEDRLRSVAALSTGFLYYVSMTGVTGSQFNVSDELAEHLGKVREYSRVPVAVGFGISQPDQAKSLVGLADGVIVGSAIIREIASRDSPKNQIEGVAELARSLSEALKTNGKSTSQT